MFNFRYLQTVQKGIVVAFEADILDHEETVVFTICAEVVVTLIFPIGNIIALISMICPDGNRTSTIQDSYHPPGCLPSRTFTIPPDVYHPGLLPSRTFTIHPDVYHPGLLPSRTFTIPDIYHPPGHLPSRTFTIPDFYHPGLLPSRTFTIPDIYHPMIIFHFTSK